MIRRLERAATFAALVVALEASPATLAGAPSQPADNPSRTRLEAAVIDDIAPIRLDGELADARWVTAVPLTEFRQREPLEGGPPSQATEVRVAYDATHLYVAVTALDDQPERIVAHLNRRDESSPSDWVHVLVDSYHDRRTAYEFAVNPAGVKVDKYWFDDTKEDVSWDAIWVEHGNFRLGRDFHGVFSIPASNVFLVKLAYWLNS